MKIVFPPNLTVNNKDFNSEINTARDEHSLSVKQIAAYNDVFDDTMKITFEDWQAKTAVHCILLEMAVDASKVAHSSIDYADTEEGRKEAAKKAKEERLKKKLDKKNKPDAVGSS